MRPDPVEVLQGVIGGIEFIVEPQTPEDLGRVQAAILTELVGQVRRELLLLTPSIERQNRELAEVLSHAADVARGHPVLEVNIPAELKDRPDGDTPETRTALRTIATRFLMKCSMAFGQHSPEDISEIRAELFRVLMQHLTEDCRIAGFAYGADSEWFG